MQAQWPKLMGRSQLSPTSAPRHLSWHPIHFSRPAQTNLLRWQRATEFLEYIHSENLLPPVV
jgi:hypothetical protein